jgi:VanZ family protein
VGWIGVGLAIYYSLTPRPPDLGIEQGDKLQHLLGYGCLMLWWSQVCLALPQRVRVALLLLALSVGLEFAQKLTDARTFSYADMAANALGILLGWLLAPPRLPNFFTFGGRLVRRSGDGRP